MENLQIHSRSYIVRWVHVGEGHSITWSVQPLKKSINFGIFKHPGNKNDLTAAPALTTSATFEAAETTTPTADGEKTKRRGSMARHDGSIVEKMQSIGLKCVDWVGKCEADKVSMGTYDVPSGQEGTYGLVFDNTFSKQMAKTATFMLMTHPTNAPPKSKALVTPYSQSAAAAASPVTVGQRPGTAASTESLGKEQGVQIADEAITPARARRNTIGRALDISDIHTGVMYKRRRKKGQGWAKRFFSLDFTSSTLSYYANSHASALRGAVPLSLAAVGADEKTREFSIDSGAEVWHLKASNEKEFDEWRIALERASQASINTPAPGTPAGALTPTTTYATPPFDVISNVEWEKAAGLLSRISGSRDAVRRLAQDTDPKSNPSPGPTAQSSSACSPSASSVESSATNPFFAEAGETPEQKSSFWKRKASSNTGNTPQGLFKRKVSNQQLTVPCSPGGQPVSPVPSVLSASKVRPSTAQTLTSSHVPIEDVHARCMALLKDLDNVVTDFSALLTETNARRRPTLQQSTSRLSIDSVASDEFFDAEDGGADLSVPRKSQMPRHSQLLNIRRSSGQSSGSDKSTPSTDELQDAASEAGDSESSRSDAGTNAELVASTPAQSSLSPIKPRSLSLTVALQSQHRSAIPPPKQPPPSLIGFLRKNAGKDLSSVSMPVSANEPLSALQRLAEPFESASLLHTAASLTAPDGASDRLLNVAAFAVTNFSANRVKERALRKPFNPMLGETYELVRSDQGFRFVSEKVVHRPVRMAWQADALDGGWSLSQSAQPTQKFWGKSAELNTEGKIRVVLHNVGESGERYSWTLAPAFLRNVIAGEKYIEPTATMTIVNETTGSKAVATFKAAGLFSGRSEDVTIAFYDPGSHTPSALSLAGKWTTSLSRTDTNAVVWEAGPLVKDAPKNWGFTTFTAALNQLDANDKKLLPPTDSRLRPDQRALEDGKLDEAEGLKARLEERQRGRRKVLESHGAEWQPRFFELVGDEGETGGEEVWGLKVGREGYWECRERNSWEGVSRVFET